AQSLPDRPRGAGGVERVEVQARRAALQQAVAHGRHHVQAERANRFTIVAKAFEALGDPARHFRTAHLGKAHQLRRIRDRHDAGHDGHFHAELACIVDELEVRVGVEEVLRDGGVRTGLDLAGEVLQIVPRRARLRVVFRIRRHFDVERLAGFLADELDQLVGEAEFTDLAHARRHVAAQRDDAADAVFAIRIENAADALARRTHARQ
ncbi:hypothetical protein COLO4_01993, partial [Corchorus olitorius]